MYFFTFSISFGECIKYTCRRARLVIFIGALMTIVPLRQLLKKDPKQGADGKYSMNRLNQRLLCSRAQWLSLAPHAGKYKERELQEQIVDLLGQNPDSDEEAVDDTVTSSSINVMDLIAKVRKLS